MARPQRNLSSIAAALSVAMGLAVDAPCSGALPVISGVVVSEQGEPVAGAIVKLGLQSNWDRQTTTGPDGAWTLEFPAGRRPESFYSFLQASDREGALLGCLLGKHPSAFAEPQKIVLKPPRRIAVRVTDADSAPVPDALVTLMSICLSSCVEARTDGTGTATLAYPADLLINDVVVRSDGGGFTYFENDRSGAVLEPGTLPTQLDLQVTGARALTVEVVDQQERPIANARVYPWLIQQPGALDRLNLGSIAVVTANESGVAQFNWLPQQFQGTIPIQAYLPGHALLSSASIEAGDGVERVRLVMSRDVTISGHAVALDGTPVRNAMVFYHGDHATNHSLTASDKVQTDEQGAFRFQGPADLDWWLCVQHPDWTCAPVHVDTVPEGATAEEVRLPCIPGVVLRGSITEGDPPAPAAGESVMASIRAAETLPSSSEAVGVLSRSDSKGRFMLRLPPGLQHIQVRGQFGRGQTHFVMVGEANDELREYLQRVREPVVHANQSGEVDLVINHHFAASRQQRLFGAVVDAATGQPLADATVQLALDGSGLTETRTKARTNAAGEFQFTRSGDRFLAFAASADGRLAGFERIDATQEAVTLALQPAATVTGRVVDHEGQPQVGMAMRLFLRTTEARSEAVSLQTVTDAEGCFAIPGAAVGLIGQLLPDRVLNGLDETFRIEGAEVIDRGELKFTRPRE